MIRDKHTAPQINLILLSNSINVTAIGIAKIYSIHMYSLFIKWEQENMKSCGIFDLIQRSNPKHLAECGTEHVESLGI